MSRLFTDQIASMEREADLIFQVDGEEKLEVKLVLSDIEGGLERTKGISVIVQRAVETNGIDDSAAD